MDLHCTALHCTARRLPRGIFCFACRRSTRIKDGRRRLVQALAYVSWDEAMRLRYHSLAPEWKVKTGSRSRAGAEEKGRCGAVKHAILLFSHGVFAFAICFLFLVLLSSMWGG